MLKNFIFKLNIIDPLIRRFEYIRGLYRYPGKMLGRNLSGKYIQSDILVIAAHPDDEILGLSTILSRHRENKKKISIAYVTNGTAGQGGSWKFRRKRSESVSKLRFKEAAEALSLLNISEENISCLGYPDSGTHRYIENMKLDTLVLMKNINPEKVYVHCIEGGHGDHDITSFVVKSVCKSIGFANLFEWTEYNKSQPIGSNKIEFSSASINKEEKMVISVEERILKKKMLACHRSQNVERFFMMGESVRKACLENPEKELFSYSMFPHQRLKRMVKKLRMPSSGEVNPLKT